MEITRIDLKKINYDLKIIVRYINEDGIKKRKTFSLRKIMTTLLLAVGIVIASKDVAKEVSFQLEKGRIGNLKETADEIAGLENNTTIVDGVEVKISDKVMEFAEKKEAYNNAKHNNASKEALKYLKEELETVKEEISEIGLNEIKEQASPYFENIDGTTLTVRRENTVGEQIDSISQEKVITSGLDQTRINVDYKEIDNTFAGNIIEGNIDKAIEQMPEFLQEGFEISEDGKTLR